MDRAIAIETASGRPSGIATTKITTAEIPICMILRIVALDIRSLLPVDKMKMKLKMT